MTKKELLQELSRYASETPVVRHPSDIVPHFIDRIGRKKQEHMVVALLNGAHEAYHFTTVSIGIANRTLVHPREVYREAVRRGAVAVIVAHNHPSGRVQPSDADDNVCRSLKQAGEILGIPMLDFMIVSKCGYTSYSEKNIL